MKVVNLSEKNSLLNQFLAEIRNVDIQRDPLRFRRNIERIGQVMALEISRDLNYHPTEVQTPLATATVNTIADPIVLGTIMRAGLPLHQGFLSMFDRAENAFISAYRRYGRTLQNGEQEVEIVSEYLAAPKMDGKTLLLVDPMLATGLSMEVAYKALLSHGTPSHLHLACVIGSQKAVDYLQETMPADCTLWCAVIDPILNEHKYIVPGLGDAGDLCYGEKM